MSALGPGASLRLVGGTRKGDAVGSSFYGGEASGAPSYVGNVASSGSRPASAASAADYPGAAQATAVHGSVGGTASNRPLVWTSPFGAAVAAFTETDPATMSTAFAAAAEAETHVRRGIAAAHHWWPNMLNLLRRYFAVSHSSVRRKCLALFIPPLGYRDVWSLKGRSGSIATHEPYRRGIGPSEDVLDCPTPSDDISETWSAQNIHHLGPDLYLPLMAVTTYILLCGIAKGALDDFHPEVLPSTASFAMGLVVFELSVVLLAFYLLGIQYLPILDVLSVLGLKFESLVVIIIAGLASRGIPSIFWSAFIYCSLCATHAAFQFLRGSEYRHRPQSEWGSQKKRHPAFLYALWGLSLLQVPLCWFLVPPLHPKTVPKAS